MRTVPLPRNSQLKNLKGRSLALSLPSLDSSHWSPMTDTEKGLQSGSLAPELPHLLQKNGVEWDPAGPARCTWCILPQIWFTASYLWVFCLTLSTCFFFFFLSSPRSLFPLNTDSAYFVSQLQMDIFCFPCDFCEHLPPTELLSTLKFRGWSQAFCSATIGRTQCINAKRTLKFLCSNAGSFRL